MEGGRGAAVGPRGRDGRAPGVAVVERRWRRAGMEPQAPAVRAARPERTPPLCGPTLPAVPYAELHCHSQLLVPRRRLAPRAAGRGGRPVGARGAGAHRPRRAVRRGALRRGGPRGRPADGVRRRDHARPPSVIATAAAPEPRPTPVRQQRVGHRRRTSCSRSARRAPAGRSPTARPATPGWLGRSAWGTWPARRERRSSPCADLADAGAGHWWVLTGCRKGAVPAALVRDGPAAARRELQRLVELFGRDRVVVELWDHGDPLDSARNDALAELAARHDLGVRRHQQRALRHAGAAPAGHRPRRGAGPAQPRRARPVAAGRRRAPTCAAVPSRPAGSCATPVWSRPPPTSAGRRRSTCRWWRRSLPPFPCPPGPTAAAHRDAVPAPDRRGRRPSPLRRTARRLRRPVGAGAGLAHHRPRARGHRGPRVRRLLPRGVGHRRVLQPGRHLLPGPGQRGQQRGLLRPRRHQGRRGVARVCCSNGSCRPSATARPTSTSTSRATAAKR